MDSDDRYRSGLVTTRETPESVRRSLAWLAEECECSEEESVRIVCDAARELREGQLSGPNAARSLAGLLQDAAALFQLLRELRPGGLPMRDLEDKADVIQLQALIEKTGYQLTEDESERGGITPQRFADTLAKVGDLVRLRKAIEAMGTSMERIQKLHALGVYLEEKGLTLEKVRAFVEFQLKLQDLGFSYDLALELAKAVTKARKKGGSHQQAAETLVALAEKGVAIESKVAKLEAQLDELGEERQDLNEEIAELKRSEGAHRQAATKARQQWVEMSNRVEGARRTIATRAAEAAKLRGVINGLDGYVKELTGRVREMEARYQASRRIAIEAGRIFKVNEVLVKALFANPDQADAARRVFAEAEELCAIKCGRRFAGDPQQAALEQMVKIVAAGKPLIEEGNGLANAEGSPQRLGMSPGGATSGKAGV